MKKCIIFCKKTAFLIISLVLVFSLIFYSDEKYQVNAATFADINQPSIFLKQQTSVTCTLAAATMLVRRASLANGNSDWADITESSMRSTAWAGDEGGLYWNFTYAGISVKHGYFSSGSKATQIQALLNNHPEGILAYNTSMPHGILITDYTDGVFYCADPSNKTPKGRIPISSSLITVESCSAYWYVSSPSIKLDETEYTSNVCDLLRYAAEHYNDGVGTGVDFASQCLLAAGTGISSTSINSLRALLGNSSFGTLYDIPVNEDGSISMVDYLNKMNSGDIVFYYCPGETDGLPYVKVVICNGMDADGYMKAYAHPENAGTEKILYESCGYCSTHISKVSVFHFNDSDANHEWNSGIVTKKATCNSTGEKKYTCSSCSTTKTELIPKDPTNHVGGTEIRNAKMASCTEEGYTGDTYCKGCNKIISSGKKIEKEDHSWNSGSDYFNNKEAGGLYTCKVCGETKSVRNEKFTSLAKADDGNWYDYGNGLVSTYTGLRYYNGSWWYVEKGKVNFNATTLCLYGGTWWYVQKGKVNFGATTLCLYNGTWWYVEKGKVNFGATTLCNYGGSWWYVQKGKVNFGATTLCNYGGSWWYVQKGKVNFGATTLCNYGGTWWYVEKGKVNFNATTLCNYGGKWWYVQKGKVNFGATTLCKYNGTWWYVEKGAVNFNYTGYFKYYGTNYRIVKGVVKF